MSDVFVSYLFRTRVQVLSYYVVHLDKYNNDNLHFAFKTIPRYVYDIYIMHLIILYY